MQNNAAHLYFKKGRNICAGICCNLLQTDLRQRPALRVLHPDGAAAGGLIWEIQAYIAYRRFMVAPRAQPVSGDDDRADSGSINNRALLEVSPDEYCIPFPVVCLSVCLSSRLPGLMPSFPWFSTGNIQIGSKSTAGSPPLPHPTKKTTQRIKQQT